jgi:hypothetical protein
VASWDGNHVVVEIDLEGPLGGFMNQLAVMAGPEMALNGDGDWSREPTLKVFADHAYGLSTSHWHRFTLRNNYLALCKPDANPALKWCTGYSTDMHMVISFSEMSGWLQQGTADDGDAQKWY